MKIDWKVIHALPYDTVSDWRGYRIYRSSANRFQCELLAIELPNETRFRLVAPEFKSGLGQTGRTTRGWFEQLIER